MQSNQQHKKTFLFLTFLLACFCSPAFSQSWSITGNANIASATQYLRTKDPNDLVFRTNAIEREEYLVQAALGALGLPPTLLILIRWGT